jgi:hypothetical protein
MLAVREVVELLAESVAATTEAPVLGCMERFLKLATQRVLLALISHAVELHSIDR